MNKWRQEYHCTGPDTTVIQEFDKGYVIEHNPNIKHRRWDKKKECMVDASGMYRINHPRGLPPNLMGYNPHKTALIAQLNKFLKRRKK